MASNFKYIIYFLVIISIPFIYFEIYPMLSQTCNINDKRGLIIKWVNNLQEYESVLDNIDKKLFLQDLVCADEYKHTIGEVTYTYDEIQNQLKNILDLKNILNHDSKLLLDYWAQREFHFVNQENTTTVRRKSQQLLEVKFNQTWALINNQIQELINNQISESKTRIIKKINNKQHLIEDFINQNVEQRSTEKLGDDPELRCVTGHETGELKSFINQPDYQIYRAFNILANLEKTLKQLKEVLPPYISRLHGLNTETTKLQSACGNDTTISDKDLNIIHNGYLNLQAVQDQRMTVLRNLKFKLFGEVLQRVTNQKNE